MIRPKLNEYSIAKGVRAFSSTRQGGVSKGVFGAFNINEFCGDNPDDIARNRLLLHLIISLCLTKCMRQKA